MTLGHLLQVLAINLVGLILAIAACIRIHRSKKDDDKFPDGMV